MAPETIAPDWTAPRRVRALVTTRPLGDMRAGGAGRAALGRLLPAEPFWLRQVHGVAIADADATGNAAAVPQADGSVTRTPGTVCAVTIADCLPVLLAADDATAVAIAHAGWRGLAGGVIEAALEAMRTPSARVVAWLGPAIGPQAYEVGDEVRAAFMAADAGCGEAFTPARPGHWRLDLYRAARRRLAARGVARVSGGAFCTHRERERFFSWRRDRDAARMAALVWIEPRVE